MKKLSFLVVLVISLCVSGVLAQTDLTAPGEFPIVNEPVTLDVLLRGHQLVQDFNTNAFTVWYQEKTGVQLNIEVAPYTGGNSWENETLNLVLASGDLPDVLVGFVMPPTLLTIYGEQGLFLPLNDLIEEQGFYTQQMLEEQPHIRQLMTSPDGNIYGLPAINECYHCFFSQRAWINEQWLENLGLEMPTTTEEFFNVLIAFRDQDANGNGDPDDEIPLSAATTGWNTNIDGFLMNPFVFSEQFTGRYLMLEDGVVQPVVNTEGWRDGLRFLNRLYNEGLLGEESFTQPKDPFYTLTDGGDAPRLGVVIAGAQSEFGSIAETRWLEYGILPPLKGPTGLRQAPQNPWSFTSGQCVISAETEYPEVAFRWCEGFYEREVTMRATQGIPGVEWDYAPEDEIGINGLPALWVRMSTFGEAQNVHWAQMGPNYRPDYWRLGMVPSGPQDQEVILYTQTNERMEPYARALDQVIPPVSLSSEQATELADIQLPLTDYVKEMTANFVLGRADPDADWDEYVATLDSLGLARYAEIYQEAYDLLTDGSM